jgi:hypothetical protein
MNIRKKQLFWGELQRIPLDFDPEPYGTAVLVPAWPWLKPTPWGGLGFQKKDVVSWKKIIPMSWHGRPELEEFAFRCG